MLEASPKGPSVHETGRRVMVNRIGSCESEKTRRREEHCEDTM
jgi:hypothetical protein